MFREKMIIKINVVLIYTEKEIESIGVIYHIILINYVKSGKLVIVKKGMNFRVASDVILSFCVVCVLSKF